MNALNYRDAVRDAASYFPPFDSRSTKRLLRQQSAPTFVIWIPLFRSGLVKSLMGNGHPWSVLKVSWRA